MDPRPILPSATDLERRRLESTIDQDLHSLSLTISNSADHPSHSHSFLSSSSISSVEYPRAFGEGLSLVHPSHHHHQHHHYPDHLDKQQGPHGTPRAAARKASPGFSLSLRDSPVSTAGHHVSAMTLADGVFDRVGERGSGREQGSEDEWDPERRLGRLVGELGRVMGDVSRLC